MTKRRPPGTALKPTTPSKSSTTTARTSSASSILPMKTYSRTTLILLLALAGAGSTRVAGQTNCAPVPAGVIAWWPAEGNADDAFDSHRGTLLNGALCLAGKVGQAFAFGGGNAVVQVPDSPVWDFITNNFTIEFWLKLNRIKDSMFI